MFMSCWTPTCKASVTMSCDRVLRAVLQGCTGEQLLQVTDKGLLQLGVQDAAERQALLTARKNLLQQQVQQQVQQHPQQQPVETKQAGVVLPAAGTPTAGSAGQQASAGMGEARVQDAQDNSEGSKKSGVRWGNSPALGVGHRSTNAHLLSTKHCAGGLKGTVCFARSQARSFSLSSAHAARFWCTASAAGTATRACATWVCP